MACAIGSLTLANSGWQSPYLQFWEAEFADHSVSYWINDGLMAVFFLLVGLELEREVYIGRLSKIRNALLPIVAALGGMLIPAGLHLLMNAGTITQGGAGIPMATDIAFSLAVLALLGSRVPISLKIFLTALAVIDDLGAIVVIAVFYTDSLQWLNLFIALSVFGVLLIFNRLKVRNLIPYLLGGIAMWYFMLHSGVHATISGVLLAFAIPFGNGDKKSPSRILLNFIHWPVAFAILPLFALANMSVVIPDRWVQGLVEWNSIGIATGLILGKPLGIFLFSYGSTALKLTHLPSHVTWKQVIGVGFLGGIGFTMSIFITILAFRDQEHIDQSKIAILISSTIAGLVGYIFLRFSLSED